MNTHRRIGSRRDEQGASAVEYGLLVALIAAVIVVAVVALGGTVQSMFGDTCDDYQSNAGPTDYDCDN